MHDQHNHSLQLRRQQSNYSIDFLYHLDIQGCAKVVALNVMRVFAKQYVQKRNDFTDRSRTCQATRIHKSVVYSLSLGSNQSQISFPHRIYQIIKGGNIDLFPFFV